MTPTKSLILAFTTGVGALGPFLAVALPAAEPEKEPDGIVLPVGGGFLKVGVRADNIIRVVYAKDRAFFTHPSLIGSAEVSEEND